MIGKEESFMELEISLKGELQLTSPKSLEMKISESPTMFGC